jgi:hypothetical protein
MPPIFRYGGIKIQIFYNKKVFQLIFYDKSSWGLELIQL